jgi:putative transposase
MPDQGSSAWAEFECLGRVWVPGAKAAVAPANCHVSPIYSAVLSKSKRRPVNCQPGHHSLFRTVMKTIRMGAWGKGRRRPSELPISLRFVITGSMKTICSHRRSYNDAGHAHELTFSCYQQLPLLKSERTCLWLAKAIDAAHKQYKFDVWAYVFMPEHVHLLICPKQPDYKMSDILTAIKHPVSKTALAYVRKHAPHWLPKLTRQRGKRTERHFWQSGGGYDRNICTGQTLLAMIDYLHLNPVRRGLVKKPEDWKWSSAGWFLKEAVSPLTLNTIPPEWLGHS